MSVRRCQAEVSSAEFGEWLAVFALEAAESGEHEATPEELAAKIGAWAGASPQRGVTLERVK
jgi:hypothetical protein